MGACEELVFSAVDRPHFDRIVRQAQSAGIPISGDAGQAGRNGFTVRWTFAERDNTLRIQCVDSPIVVPCSVISARLVSLVESCRPMTSR
jgi:hypothetical protein